MTTLNAARDLGTTKKRAANEAPKHHAKKAKTSISVAGLFAKKPRTVREGLQPTDGTSRRHRSVEDELTAKARRHPIYLDVKGVRLRASTDRQVANSKTQKRYQSTLKMTAAP